jgi:hypothetical protein
VDTALYYLTRVLIVLASIGVIGCLLVIPWTAASILRVAFQEDTPTELAQTEKLPPQPAASK